MPKPKSSKSSKASKASKSNGTTGTTVASSSSAAAAAAASSTPPSWPNFKPPLPIVPLTPQLHPSTPKIALLPSFFPRSLCRDYVAFLRTLPLQTTPARPRRGEAVRVNDRFQVHDPAFAVRLWEHTGLRDALLGTAPDDDGPLDQDRGLDGAGATNRSESLRDLWGGEPVGLNPNIRVYRYSQGQYFDCHYDDHNDLTLPPNSFSPSAIPVRTTWTLLLYLTSSAEGCVGGETVFYPHDRKSAREEIVIPLETGTLLLHKHGDDCLLHEGREVTAGEKWVIRTDLCIKR